MSHRRLRPQRGMTLLEVMVVSVAAVAIAAAGGSTLVEQAHRSRAIDAANNAMLPHTVARDRAVAARTCTESVLLPPLSQAFFDFDPELPAQVIAGRRDNPRIAVIQWSDCGGEATVTKIDFYDLDGAIEFDAYSSPDGRLVFDIDGALTNVRPGVPATLPGGGAVVCGAGRGGGRGGEEGPTGPGLPDGRPADPPSCTPSPRINPNVLDVTFSARTYFGEEHLYKTWARLGATEATVRP